jgi:hypothetical protein
MYRRLWLWNLDATNGTRKEIVNPFFRTRDIACASSNMQHYMQHNVPFGSISCLT